MSTTKIVNMDRWKQWVRILKQMNAGEEGLFEVEIRRLHHRQPGNELERAAIREAILMLEGIEYRVNAARRFQDGCLSETGNPENAEGAKDSLPGIRE